jgi:predicted permease
MSTAPERDATHDWKRRLQSALSRCASPPDDGVIEELAQHARAMYESARADGAAPDEALRRVELQIAIWAGDTAILTHRVPHDPDGRDTPPGRSSWGAGLLNDVRFAWRLSRRQSAFTALVVSMTALGIAATTTLFSVTYGVLMKPLPWPEADRLVLLEETRGGNRPRFNSFSNAAYLAWREQKRTIEDLAAWAPRTMTLGDAGEPERIRVAAATSSLFRVLEVRPLFGTLYGEENELSAAERVVVLSERLWRQRFGADRGVLGRSIRLDAEPHRIIAILPDAVAYPDRETRAWVPFRVPLVTGNLLSMFSAIAKLRPGATSAQAAAEGTARGRHAPDTGLTAMAIFGSNGAIEIAARPLREAVTASVRRPLLVLLAAVVLLLVTAVANVASLQAAKATGRRRELAIRAALGAGGGRVMRQLLIENVQLGLAGGLIGLALSLVLHRYLPVLLPADFPRLDHVGMNATVVSVALALAVASSVAFGVLPALHARRENLMTSLAEGAAPTGTRMRSRSAQTRLVIMTVQVAIACNLLIGASLLGRSFVALINADRGYDPSGVLTGRLALATYSPERRYSIVRQVLDRLTAAPAVVDAAFTSELPLTAGGSTSAFTMTSRTAEGQMVSVQASPRIVSPRAFHALGLRVSAGRPLDDSDTETSLPVVVVNQTFVRRYLGDEPLGARLPMGAGYGRENVQATVVGIVDDVRYLMPADATQPEMYYSYRQFSGRLPVPGVTMVLRTEGDPNALASAFRAAAREADDRLVPDAVATMEDRVLTSLARPRLYAVLLGGFALIALAIAAVGLFAVLSYTVGQRSRELAVRAALGARQLDLVRLIVNQGLRVTIGGVVVGLAGSIVLGRALGALLYGVTRNDPLTLAGVPALLLLVAAAACVSPARRAARLDPLRLLKRP